jgi:hypothetical protein
VYAHAISFVRSPLVLTLVILLLLPGCLGPEVRDVRLLPQTPSSYAPPKGGQRLAPEAVQAESATRFLEHHFRPWHAGAPPDDLFWGIRRYQATPLYDAGGRKRSVGWFERLVDESAQETFPNAGYRAITVRSTSLRVMPTAEGAFLKPSRPGEGYPFDYFQNSALWANTPVRITHVSRSGAWVLAESALASGWLPAHDVALVDDQLASAFEQGSFVALTRDSVHVLDREGGYRFVCGIGSLHPVIGIEKGSWRILTAASDEAGRAVLKEALLPLYAAAPFPLPLTAAEIVRLGDRMADEPYSWGGLDGGRDCSALLRDLFAGFGLWLPRNSAQQAKIGTIISLDGLSLEEKERVILEQGVPLLTLLWRPGHIMLLVGKGEGRPVIWHQIWGVRSWDVFKGQRRVVIGRAAVTTLTPGVERANVSEERSLLATLRSMNILLQQPPTPIGTSTPPDRSLSWSRRDP